MSDPTPFTPPPPPAPPPPPPSSGPTTTHAATLGPASDSDSDTRGDADLIAAAAATGVPVIDNPDIGLDPTVSMMVPPDAGVIPLGFHDDFLDVGFRSIPSPQQFDALRAQIGTPIRIVLCTAAAFRALHDRWQSGVGETRPPLESILDAAIASKASDIHLAVGVPPTLRVAGGLTPIAGWGPLTVTDVEAMARYVAGDLPFGDDFTGDFDSAITYGTARFRVALFRQRQTLSLVLRMIPTQIPAFDSLGLPRSIAEFSELRQGLVLVCGVTGSGKSTTLASVVDRINRNRAVHILTIEDPIEFVHPSRQSMVRQREVGDDTVSFAAALRGALRADPDVILVGEMRDLETISMAISAAETGHLVFGTLHSQTAASTIDRIIDVYPPEQQNQIRVQLASSLAGIVCQTLLPAADQPGKRYAICEVLVMTPGVRNMIREGTTHQLPSTMQTGVRDYGMQPMDLGLAKAVATGKVSVEDAAGWVQDKSSYQQYLDMMRNGQLPAD